MADWNLPSLPDTYSDFMDRLKNRDLDAGTLFLADPTNPPVGLIRYNRTANTFQEWSGSAWVNKILAAAGGGTGSATGVPPLGTMASQNANAVNITGGQITGQALVQANGEIQTSSNLRVLGILVTGNPPLALTDANGKIPNISTSYFASVNGQNLTNLNGSAITTGVIFRDRLGSGAVGDGSRVLYDNGTWWTMPVETGLGGVFDQVVADASFAVGEYEKDFTIPWVKGNPTHMYKVNLRINMEGGPFIGTGGGSWVGNFHYRVLTVNTFRITRVGSGGNPPAGATVIQYTAQHMNIQGY